MLSSSAEQPNLRQALPRIERGERWNPSTVLGAEADRVSAQLKNIERQRFNVVRGDLKELEAQQKQREEVIVRLRTEESKLRELAAGLIKKSPDAVQGAMDYFDKRIGNSAAELRTINEQIEQEQKNNTPEYQTYAKYEALRSSAEQLEKNTQTGGGSTQGQSEVVRSIENTIRQTPYGKRLVTQENVRQDLERFQTIRAQLEREGVQYA